MEKYYKIAFFGLIFVIAVAGAYYFGSYQASTKIPPTPTPTEIPLPTTESGLLFETPMPTAGKKMTAVEVKENIKAAIETKNYAALEGYMTDSVSVILEASECCGPVSKSAAVGQLDYLKDATLPWNFDQTNDTIKKLKTQEPSKYGPDSAYIGIAANEFTVAFKFAPDGRINGITMAVTYKLVLP